MEKNLGVMKDLAIILLNYNSFDDTSRGIISLLNEGCPRECIYVVDNNSGDKEDIKNLGNQKGINIIISDHNGGYAFGNNLAIKKALTDGKNYFLLLNPDIEISLDTISKLYLDLKNLDNLGMIGPRICYRNDRNKIFSDGGLLFPEKGFMGDHINYEKYKENVEKSDYNFNIQYVDGSALMFKKEILNDVGYMNEAFFMYYEESEWCLRLLSKSSWKIAVNTSCLAYNLFTKRSTFYQYYMTRNRIWLCRLYNGNVKYVTKERWTLARRALKKGKFAMAKAYTKGILDGLYSNLQLKNK